MRVLFDQNVPRKLRRHLRGHYVVTADERGWAAVTNGDLLRLAEDAGFDILLSADQSVAYQQNLADRKIALIILSSNHWDEIRAEVSLIAQAPDDAQTGSYKFIQIQTASEK